MKNKKILKVVSLMMAATACAVAGVFALNMNTANAASEDVFHELGASVRVSADKGIRFAFGLPENLTGEGYEIGTLVIPKEVLGDAELNHNDDTADEVDVDYLPIPCTKKWVDTALIKDAKEGYNYYNAALTEIPEFNYNTVLVARSYYVKDGVYTYSAPIERSIGYVASAALNDGYDDKNGTLAEIVNTGYGDTTLTIAGGKELITAEETLTFTASNDKGYLPVWSSSNEKVATIDKDGNVTVARGGEVTFTATIGEKTASKTVYVVGDGLYSDQIGARINGWNMSSNATYCGITIGDNGEMTVNTQFPANATYSPALVVRNLNNKAYYEALIANGYTKLTFNLGVQGNTTDLYVFGKELSSFPEKEGVYTITVDTNQFVSYYDTMYTIATSGNQVGQASSISAKLLTWKSPANDWSTVRDYTFTLSNIAFKIPSFEVDFAEDSTDFVSVGKTTTLEAKTNVGGEVAWKSSDESVATVENGVVTGVKGGIVTITATFYGKEISKTIYVMGLTKENIGARINGWNMSSNADYCGITVGANGEMTIKTKFQANATYSPALVLRNLQSKSYYETLIANGYTKLTFNLAVVGDTTDLYVFGKKITTFAKNSNGAYTIAIDTQHFVSYYDTMNTIATSGNQVGQSSSISAKLITWKSPTNDWSTVREYTFTLSNVAFRQGVLFSDNIGMRVNGWNMTTNTTYMTLDLGTNGEMIITANWQAYANYGPALVLKNIQSKEYYQNLINSGYTYLTFDLKVGGDDADKLDDVHILGSAQKVSACEQVDGVYKVKIQLAHIVQFYDTITTLDTSGNQAGQWGSRSALLLAWRFSTNFATVPADATRNYVFTISNTAYAK